MKGTVVSIRQLFNEDGTHNCYEVIIDFNKTVPIFGLGDVCVTKMRYCFHCNSELEQNQDTCKVCGVINKGEGDNDG